MVMAFCLPSRVFGGSFIMHIGHGRRSRGPSPLRRTDGGGKKPLRIAEEEEEKGVKRRRREKDKAELEKKNPVVTSQKLTFCRCPPRARVNSRRFIWSLSRESACDFCTFILTPLLSGIIDFSQPKSQSFFGGLSFSSFNLPRSAQKTALLIIRTGKSNQICQNLFSDENYTSFLRIYHLRRRRGSQGRQSPPGPSLLVS